MAPLWRSDMTWDKTQTDEEMDKGEKKENGIKHFGHITDEVLLKRCCIMDILAF